MKIGLARHEDTEGWDSLRYVHRTLEQALKDRHEIVYFTPKYRLYSKEKRLDLAREFVSKCDLIFNRENIEVYEARMEVGKHIPIIHYLLGDMARGAPVLARVGKYLTNTDILVSSCTADVEIVRKFFSNAQIRLLPFAIEHEQFYPLDAVQRRAVRKELGIREENKILLYTQDE